MYYRRKRNHMKKPKHKHLSKMIHEALAHLVQITIELIEAGRVDEAIQRLMRFTIGLAKSNGLGMDKFTYMICELWDDDWQRNCDSIRGQSVSFEEKMKLIKNIKKN